MAFDNRDPDHTVSRLTSRPESELQPATLQALEPARMKGRLADVYLQFANSEPALRAYLYMEASLREGSLEVRELEAIKLWVSEQTQCDYCLSIHSFKAGQAGLDRTLQSRIRQGQSTGETRLDALLALASQLFRTPGKLDEDLLSEARNAGLSDQNLVDLTMAISTIFFTNITNHINDSASPLPPAPNLD